MSRLVEDVEALLTLSGVCANPSPDVQENADNCASPYSANLKHTLQELSKRAYRHSVNLNGRVTRNNGVIRRGGYATVYEGTLRTQGTTMFTGSARHSPPKDEFKTTKVASWQRSLSSIFIIFVYSTP
ncbi:hypothetical protein ID866_6719 [Astraeus odoratus]|nr:hypothetical protein ID866_6719 [Astraeus odoratus]